MKTFLFRYLSALVLSLLLAVPLYAESSSEKKTPAMEIEGPKPELQGNPIPEIKPLEKEIPEVPKKITRTGLTPAEAEELRQEERRLAKGEITQTEYEIKKDSLARDANLKF